MGRTPKLATKWLPEQLCRSFEKHRGSITAESKIGVWIDVWSEDGTTVANLAANYPTHVSERLKVPVRDIRVDWAELAELAAWVVGIDDQNQINAVKWLVRELDDNHYIHLERTYCTSYRRRSGADDELLRRITL